MHVQPNPNNEATSAFRPSVRHAAPHPRIDALGKKAMKMIQLVSDAPRHRENVSLRHYYTSFSLIQSHRSPWHRMATDSCGVPKKLILNALA